MCPKGRTPSLISGSRPKPVTAKKKRHCRRCNIEIHSGTDCIVVPVHKTYCKKCFSDILIQSRKDLGKIETQIL